MSALLTAAGLTKSYGGVRAVDNVSFSLEPGEIVALIGPNGAGKTTCFKMLSGQIEPDRGHVFIGERETTGLPPKDIYRLGVGRTFQITETFASMTVRENVQVALLSHHRALHKFYSFAPRAYRAEAERILGKDEMIALKQVKERTKPPFLDVVIDLLWQEVAKKYMTRRAQKALRILSPTESFHITDFPQVLISR